MAADAMSRVAKVRMFVILFIIVASYAPPQESSITIP